MSIVERVAELLGSTEQPGEKPRTPEVEGSSPGPDLIERAAANLLQRRAPSRVGEPAPQAGATARPVRPSAGTPTARLLKVDRALLRAQGIITPDSGRTAISESFRRIKRQVLANIAGQKPGAPPANLVMVTSALQGEGKSFCAINLAISLALEVDRTVLLVDADVAKASIPRAFGLKAETGLMEMLHDRRVGLADVLWKTDIGSLALLPVGLAHKHATELLASDAMRGLLRELTERYHDRIVVFDSPPLLAASEAGALAGHVGQIVVVVEAGRTPEAALQDALGRVDASRVAGLILNKLEGPRPEYGYGYGAAYG